MKYLVTGSTGFIGSRLLGLLSTIECDVGLLARSKVNNYETVVCNLRQDRISKHALESINTVFHLAGFAHDMQDPSKVEDLYRLINVDATVELARLAVESGVKRFVFISSVKAGGSLSSGKCINESDQNEPEGVYGKTKLYAIPIPFSKEILKALSYLILSIWKILKIDLKLYPNRVVKLFKDTSYDWINDVDRELYRRQ